MRRLILLRHAKTETDAPSGKDQDRRLDDRGRADAAEIAGWLIRNQLLPDFALVSTAVRARQTWDILAALIPDSATQPEVQHLPDLYAAGAAQMLQEIRNVAGAPKRLLVVGHNPGLQELALGLTCKGDAAERKALGGNMPTSGLVVLDFALSDWADASFGGGKLSHFVSPKILREKS
jgi:phosphohistidine phosphatase